MARDRAEGAAGGSRAERVAKRALDVVASAGALVALAPALAAIAAAIRLGSPGPVLYRGVRAGRGGRPFDMLKFRTMVDGAERMGVSSTAEDDRRITRVGRFLRRIKLDELPQLLNVLRGEMSLVGPRPQVPWAVARYSPEERRVLSVRPGITDPASLRFRNEGEILKGSTDPDRTYMELIHPEKMRLSLAYVESRTFLGDLRIIGDTLLALARR